MKLKNIHNRKDFVKAYELFGGTEGGVGAKDGFANNLALKDTVLGKLINGMFKGISWLWRKSKENFVINKLIAKLTNELLRGVILYSFDKNINLQTGEITKTEENPEENPAEEQPTEEPYEEPTEEPVEEPTEEPTEKPTEEPVEEPTKEPEEPIEVNFEPIKKDVEKVYGKLDLDNLNDNIKKTAKIPIDIKADNPVVDYDDGEYNNIVKNMYDFLKTNVKGYESMTDDQKERVKIIYMNYQIIKNLKDKVKAQNESYSINEENIVNTTAKKVASTGLVKPKLDNPEAGKVGVGKSIAMKAGANANVGDILTKRDRDKYRETKADDYKIDINSINLAEIEKIVEKESDQDKVSAQVNPENLKMIQLTAQELFLPPKSEKAAGGTEKTALQLRWNKELTRIYASFTRIMNIHDVDIRGEYRNELESKVSTKVQDYSKRTTGQENAARLGVHFNDVLEENTDIKFSDLNGKFALLSFYCKESYYNAAVNHVITITKDFKSIKLLYLLKISNTFGKMENDKPTSNFEKFKKEFTAGHADRNVYFLFMNPALKPGYSSSVMVLNEDAKTNELYIFYRNSVNKDLIEPFKNLDISSGKLDKKFLWSINFDSLRLFKLNLNDDWKKYFNYDKDINFIVGKTPEFYKNNEIKEKFKEIATKTRT